MGLAWLAWVALVPLLVALDGLSFKEGFRCGFLAGIFHYLTLLYWLVPTMERYGPLPLYVSVPLLVLLSAYLSLFPAVFSGIVTRMPLRALPLLLGIPALWVFFEHLRATLLTGFPWALVGYSQVKALHLIQVSDIFGVYGVSFLLVTSSTALFCQYLAMKGRLVSKTGLAPGALLWAAVLIGAAFLYGGFRIRQVDAETSRALKVRICIVQGNIEQALKWDPKYQETTVQKYLSLTKKSQDRRPDLVVWPETATPFYFLKDERPSAAVLEGIRSVSSAFMIGSPAYEQRDGEVAYFNSAYLMDAKGAVLGRYDKAHLVPYGEYVPLKRWMPFLGKMVAQVGDFTPGRKGKVLNWNGKGIGTLICYEGIFPYLARAMVKNGAQVLVNLTNDAWYGDTSAPYQHFYMAAFRAVENRRALVRSANTGISGFIDPAGRVTAQTPVFKEAVLTRDVPLLQATALYTRFGDWFPLACIGMALMVSGLTPKNRTQTGG